MILRPENEYRLERRKFNRFARIALSKLLHMPIGVRANIHLGGGGSNRVLPEWRTQIVCHAGPPGRKNNNELLQCLIVDHRRVVPYERLLCLGLWLGLGLGLT